MCSGDFLSLTIEVLTFHNCVSVAPALISTDLRFSHGLALLVIRGLFLPDIAPNSIRPRCHHLPIEGHDTIPFSFREQWRTLDCFHCRIDRHARFIGSILQLVYRLT